MAFESIESKSRLKTIFKHQSLWHELRPEIWLNDESKAKWKEHEISVTSFEKICND